jgi:signal transduction histidine kinase/CheY-like chemotaxis protein
MAKILIIDDRPRNRQFLTTLLGYQHHHLSEASDGDEGLRVAREERPDLIISDVLMPTMDGYEFVRRLREEPEIGKTTVVFNTAHYLSHESKALADKCGVSSIIFKPCEPQVVLDIVAAALAEQAEPEPEALAQPEEFDREHLKLLTNKLSEKADQVRDAHEKLTALIELSTDLAEERDPVELLNRYCSVAREVIGARWTLVALLERDQKAVHHVGAVGIDLEDSPALRSALLEAGIFKTLVNEGRTICLSDVTSTPGALRLPDSLPRAASLLVVPLIIRGCIDGWICLADKLGLDAFSEQDERLGVALAAKMAIAYDNARLYSDSMKYAGNLKETNQQLEQALQQLQGKTNELTAMTQQLWQASKLATMGELAASVAHELNNPLATVALRAEALMEELLPDDPRSQSLKIISQEIERMGTLVGNLLSFSRRSQPEISTLDLRKEIMNSLEFFEHYLRSHKVDVVREFASDLPSVHADRQQLRQVFLNLITNASDAMPRGGTLTLRAFSGVLGARPAVVIEFSDTGTGVKTGNLAKLWEPFFTTKPVGKGTGLGLAICRRTVEGHHGVIEIETGPGKGATVRITLPANDAGED